MSKKKQEKNVIDFTDRIDKLLDKKPKSGSLKEWNAKWNALMKEFLGDEQTGKKKAEGGGKESKQGKDVGTIPADLAGETTV